MTPVRQILGGRPTVVVQRGASVLEAARLMTEQQIGAVPVLDGSRLVGIFTERDLMARVVAAALDPAATLIGDVMSTTLVVADLDESHDACLARMQQARVRHLVVMDQGRMAGLLSLRDLLAVEINERDEALTLLNACVHHIPADLMPKKKTTVSPV